MFNCFGLHKLTPKLFSIHFGPQAKKTVSTLKAWKCLMSIWESVLMWMTENYIVWKVVIVMFPKKLYRIKTKLKRHFTLNFFEKLAISNCCRIITQTNVQHNKIRHTHKTCHGNLRDASSKLFNVFVPNNSQLINSLFLRSFLFIIIFLTVKFINF